VARIWAKKEEDFLRKHYRRMSSGELAKKFGVSPDAVRKKEKRLGLVREHPRRKGEKKVTLPPSRKWTGKEEEYLREHYLEKTNAELAKRFKTTLKSVEKKLWRMGLKRRKGKEVNKDSGGEGERRSRIKELFREKPRPGRERRIAEQRSRAIAQFDVAVRFYYAKKYVKAVTEFEKLSKDFVDIGDIVYKAKQYIKFCLDKK
jgi:DNA-binding CsgD family transcriptional regulator